MKLLARKTVLTLAALAFAAGVGLSGQAKAADVPESDDAIIIAMNDWTGQHFNSYVYGRLLEKMGYNIEYVTAGYYPQVTAIADGTLTISTELWSSNMGPGWSEVFDGGNILDAGALGLAAKEAWYYNQKSLEMCPGLADGWEAIRDCGEIWADAETFPNGRLVDYPIEWGTKNVDRIAALDLPLVSSPSGSEGAEVAEIISAYERDEPLLVNFWEPHWIMVDYDLIELPLPEYVEGCWEDPSLGINPDMTFDCGWAPTRIFKVAWSGMQDKWPAAYQLLVNLNITNDDQEPVLKAVDVDGADLKEVVEAWLVDNESRWQGWIDDAKM